MEKYNLRQWLVRAVSGLILTGAGLCMSIDAGFVRSGGGDWFLYGTFSLSFFSRGFV
jgi:hypothetical protein